MKTVVLSLSCVFGFGVGFCDGPGASRAQVCTHDRECGDRPCELGRCESRPGSSRTPASLPRERASSALHQGRSRTAFASESLTPRFRLALGEHVHAAPCVLASGDALVVTESGRVVVFDSSGRILREARLGFDVLSSPATDVLGRVLFAGREGQLRVLDASLRELARGELGDRVEGPVTALPLGIFAVPTRGLALVDPAAVELRRLPTPTVLRGGAAYHTGGFVLFGTPEGRLLARRVDGTPVFDADAGASVDGAPAVAADGSILLGNDLGELVRFDTTGRRIATHRAELDVRATPSLLSDGRVVMLSLDGRARLLPPAFTEADPPIVDLALSAPLAAQALVDARDRILFGGQDGRLHLLAADGRELAVRVVGADLDLSPRLLPDGTAIVVADDGAVHGFR